MQFKRKQEQEVAVTPKYVIGQDSVQVLDVYSNKHKLLVQFTVSNGLHSLTLSEDGAKELHALLCAFLTNLKTANQPTQEKE